MTRRLISLLTVFVSLVSLSVSETHSQSAKLSVLFGEQPNSPIRLTFASVWIEHETGSLRKLNVSSDGNYPVRPRDLSLKLENVGSKPIIAYALVSSSAAFHNVQVNPQAKPLEPGKALFRGFGTGGQEQIAYHIDYVLFEDGSSWGEDRYGRSKIIGLYLEARKDAMQELRRLAARYPAPDEFVEQASDFAGFVYSDRVGPQSKEILERQTRLAWFHVVSMLLRFERRLNEASEIAYKLEALIPEKPRS